MYFSTYPMCSELQKWLHQHLEKRVFCQTFAFYADFPSFKLKKTDGGEKIHKFFDIKLKLNKERVDNVKKITGLPDIDVATNAGVCKKCYRSVESILKTEEKNQITKQRFREIAETTMKSHMLQLPSPRRKSISKRMLRSPSMPSSKKQTLVNLSYRKLVQIAPFKDLTNTTEWQKTELSLPVTCPPEYSASTNIPIAPKEKQGNGTWRELVVESVPKSSKRALFSSALKSDQYCLDGKVEVKINIMTNQCLPVLNFQQVTLPMQVSVYYASGKKSVEITNDAHKTICKAFIRGKGVEKIIVDSICKANKSAVIHGAGQIMKEESQRTCKRGNSLLQRKDYHNFFGFHWKDMYEDLSRTCPSLLELLSSVVCDIPAAPPSKPFVHIMLAAAVALHGRNQEMSLMHYFTGFILTHGGCTQRDIERLSKIGFSVHPQTVHKKLISWQDNLDMDLISIRDSWAEGDQTKFQIIGDNWDKNILPSYRTSDRKTLSLHLFNMYAIVDRVVPASSTNSLTENRPELDNLKFIPSTQEQELLLKEMTFLCARSVIENIPQIGNLFHKIYPDHLEHKYSRFAGLKTTQYPLGLYDCNETKTADVVQLLKKLTNLYVPMKDDEIVEPVFFGGDRLTDERVQGAQQAMSNAGSAKERLEGFISKTEDFHRLMNFLEAIHKMTFSTESASDPGTVYYYRNVLNMRNVKGKVKNLYRPHKMLYYTVLDGIIMALFYNHFGLKDFESDIPVPEHFQNFTEEQKLHWLNDICEEIVQKWFFDNGTDICQSLREVLSDPNHPENYWTENICEGGRIKCHFCEKDYAFIGSLKSHESKVHNFVVMKDKKPKKKNDSDELQDYISLLFKLTLLHKNLDTAVDMGDGERSVRSTKYELPIYNRTRKVKYVIGSIHLSALTSGVLEEEQCERLVANRFVNVQGGRNNNIALDEYLEILNRESKIACSGHQTKKSIIEHSKEYPHLVGFVQHLESISDMNPRKGFHHLPNYHDDVKKVALDLVKHNVLCNIPKRQLQSRCLVNDKTPFENCYSGLPEMIYRHKPSLPYRRLRSHHI